MAGVHRLHQGPGEGGQGLFQTTTTHPHDSKCFTSFYSHQISSRNEGNIQAGTLLVSCRSSVYRNIPTISTKWFINTYAITKIISQESGFEKISISAFHCALPHLCTFADLYYHTIPYHTIPYHGCATVDATSGYAWPYHTKLVMYGSKPKIPASRARLKTE